MKQTRNTATQRALYVSGIITVFMVFFIVVLRYYFPQTFDIRSRAGEQGAKKTSIRLRTMENPHEVGVFVNTGGFPTAQADAVLSFDPDVLEIDDADIELLPAYKVIDIDRPQPGVLFLSMFISDSIDSDVFASSTDQPVAVLKFQTLLKNVTTDIRLVFDPKNPVSSGLYPPRGNAQGVINILSNVYDMSLSIP